MQKTGFSHIFAGGMYMNAFLLDYPKKSLKFILFVDL